MSDNYVTSPPAEDIYLSKEDFYKLCHIGKETALWLIKNGLVYAEKPSQKGLGYRIPKSEVDRYLADREIHPKMYLPSGCRNKYTYGSFLTYNEELAERMREVASEELESWPDVLRSRDIAAYLGYVPDTVARWARKKGLKRLAIGGISYFPKPFILDFIASKNFHNITKKSAKHIELIRRAQHEGYKDNCGH